MAIAVEVIKPLQGMSLEEFLSYDNDTDILYELDNGELVGILPESDLNERIAIALLIYFSQVGVAQSCLRVKTEVVVSGMKPTVRIPDLSILSDEGVQALEGASRATVTLDMPPPQLVVEVVSPESVNRDYRYKLSQYQARGIPEYWIIDPMEDRVTLLVLVDGLYESRVFTGEEILESPFLQGMGGDTPAQALRDRRLSAAQVLRGRQ
ncbi:MAG: Uma2 family endonuclease [Roseofilum sp. SBFL]|uniref:Uma2 family endonuclease n=1 Tax=unclassified Roseofilum TaxID=2620099 RepID=UPI001B2D57FC|nr:MULTISPECIES: Uma2 family endonuclease [unclassified Roseofilum]MBP0015747.1 Uma2 family endonuclease [Roseofilum sp. SID3]MBP0025799.1 Uma2 family endonuclease [Roseofilum sp. SID2]MBP0037325.1 Uma2 family endonuclease [Roseofilum sp. SID1]MBP0041301.1 Uma2 family endonuclease [Roseofilum sp. SBFL]